MSQPMQLLSALLCMALITTNALPTDLSEESSSDNSRQLLKRDADRFDVLSEFDGDMISRDESFEDEDNSAAVLDELDDYSVLGNSAFDTNGDFDKRAPLGIYGSLGKRLPMGFYGSLGKRVPMGFYGSLGKRVPVGFIGSLGKRAPMGFYGSLGKRSPYGFYGKLGKRLPQGLYGVLGKRSAPIGFVGHLGRRAPMGMFGSLGKREQAELYNMLEKRGGGTPFGLMSQLGKRSLSDEDHQDSTHFTSREKRSPASWMYAQNQNQRRTGLLNAKMTKRPEYRFFL